MNFVIIGKFTDDIEKDRAAFREAENSLACFGHGVMNPARLPSDMNNDDRHEIALAYIAAADAAYLLPDALNIDSLSGTFNGPDWNVREEVANVLTHGLPIYSEYDLVAYDNDGMDGAGGRLLYEAGQKKKLYDRHLKKVVATRGGDNV